MVREGGCLCGAIRFTFTGEPELKALCHCLDCRRQTSTAFSIDLCVPSEAIKVTKGTPSTSAHQSEQDTKVTKVFCRDCGSPLWTETPTFEGKKMLKAGALDDLSVMEQLEPQLEMFTARRVPWLKAVPGAEQHERM